MFKVDVFIPKESEFGQLQFAGETSQIIATTPEEQANVATAEDMILAKLEWYSWVGKCLNDNGAIFSAS